MGQLAQLYIGGHYTNLHNAAGALAVEYDGSTNAVARRYVDGPGTDEPIVWYEGAGTGDRRFLLADERGSVVAVSDGSGAVTAVNTYDEYGVPGSGNVGRFQYTGQKWLAGLGVYDYKARMYAPGLGRFLQPDPIGYGDGMNWYGYVGGDPVNNVDPSGLSCANGEPGGNEADCKNKGGYVLNSPFAEPQGSDIPVVGSRHARLTPGGANISSRSGTPSAGESGGGGGAETLQNVEDEPVEEARLALPKALIKWLLRTKPAAKPVPKVVPPPKKLLRTKPAAKPVPKVVPPPKNWKPPIHGPQAPPTSIPQGWRVREMGPNSNYPNGYWRLEKPVGNGGWQGINPSTGKPGPQWETHIPFP